MAETYLVLGASSFYGSSFVRLLSEKGEKPIVPETSWRLGVKLGKLLRKADYVVNFASRSLVAESWADPCGWMAVNGVMTLETVQEMLGAGIKKFIHVSTPEVYGNTKKWVAENYSNWKPSTPYAVSRAAADMALSAYYRAYGFPAVITRTANIYGEGQPTHRVIPTAFAHRREGRPISLHGGGTAIRGFIHVSDAAEALHKISKIGQAGETYHIATRQATQIRELVKMIGCEIGPDIPDRLGKDKMYLLDSTKLRALGWHDRTRLADWIAKQDGPRA